MWRIRETMRWDATIWILLPARGNTQTSSTVKIRETQKKKKTGLFSRASYVYIGTDECEFCTVKTSHCFTLQT